MSRWYVTAIERLGHPDPSWPTIYGPAAGTDPVADNALNTLDLTPYLSPLTDFSQQMERDLTGGSFSSISLDLSDSEGTLGDSLGPFSATMATATRFYGPWIQVLEVWPGNSVVRFVGYVDETSIEWSEDNAATQLTVIHASQLLQERLVTDFPELLRPWPSVPTGTTQEFTQSTADALLDSATDDFTPRATATAIEAALWANGQLSWVARTSEATVYRVIYHPDMDPTHGETTTVYPVPDTPAASVIIGGNAYAVHHLAWDTDIVGTLTIGDPATNGSIYTKNPVRIYLQGAPDLTGILTLGATVTWGIPEVRRTHYLLQGGAITAPASGSDGQKFVKLNTVEQLAVGDVLTLTFEDATSGAPRTVTADLPKIIDLDGETGKAYLASALSQGYTHVSKVRRNNQDPVLFDGVAYASALVAPFELSTAQFTQAPTENPVLALQPYDVVSPPLYGVVNCQTVSQAGLLRLSRRGADNGAGGFTAAGVWQGTWGGTWSWVTGITSSSTHEIYGDTLQFPGGTNPYTSPVIYIEGDLSAGAVTPPNGWRAIWRSWAVLTMTAQDPESTWDGSVVDWATATASGDIPAKVVAFAASTATPGRYTRGSSGAWSFSAHTADATLGTPSTPTITGTYPTGNTLALGMGIYASGDEREALLALIATGGSHPFTDVTACLMDQASGGNLTVLQSQSLWATGAIPAGAWGLGGGLVVQTWAETIDGIDYPHTVLHKLNGASVATVDLKTMEVIPQTIQPLLLQGTAGAETIGGWYALALETFSDSNYAPSRRLRFLHLNDTLTLVNGTPEPDPSTPTDADAYFSRGEVVSSITPDGSIIARMVRISNTQDRFAGIVGGRLFTVANEIPRTVEHLIIGASEPPAATLSVANSGDGMTVYDYLNGFAAAQLASIVPAADGSIALVSRALGTQRLRAMGGGEYGTVLATERGGKRKTQAWQGYIRKVRVSYTDILTGDSTSVEVASLFDGGKVMEIDVTAFVSSSTMASAIGNASAYWFGIPVPILNETWVDLTYGASSDLTPVWWTAFQVGDRVIYGAHAHGATVDAYKILTMTPGLENRTVNVELRKQPYQIVMD